MNRTNVSGDKAKLVISEARISRGSQKVIASVVGLLCFFIIATAIPSGVLLMSAALVAVIALLTVSVLRISVTIEATGQNLTVRCRPFYSKTIPLQDIVDASPAPVQFHDRRFRRPVLGPANVGVAGRRSGHRPGDPQPHVAHLHAGPRVNSSVHSRPRRQVIGRQRRVVFNHRRNSFEVNIHGKGQLEERRYSLRGRVAFRAPSPGSFAGGSYGNPNGPEVTRIWLWSSSRAEIQPSGTVISKVP